MQASCGHCTSIGDNVMLKLLIQTYQCCFFKFWYAASFGDDFDAKMN